jgi:primosomal protein N'
MIRITDNWGNEFHGATFDIRVSADKTPPAVTELKVATEETLKIKFDKNVSFSKNNVEVLNADGSINSSINITVTGSDMEYTINLGTNMRGKSILVKIKNVEDKSLIPNKLVLYTAVLDVIDMEKPYVTKITKKIIPGGEQSIYVFFNEKVSGTALVKDNYFINDAGTMKKVTNTPSIETYYRAKQGEISLLEMKERVNNALMPAVELVDMREELNQGNRSVFSRKLSEEISKNTKLDQQTMLFLNRRGYASFVLCRNCGYVVKCINCSITLTYHAIGERLTCHYCGYTMKSPKECPKCKSKHIRHFGLGTQKLEEEVKKQFPESTVIRMDSDTTGYKNSHADILGKFRDQNINMMVGTQMIAKGHDFPNVTLVGVMAADGMLNLADYRASEKTFQLLTQVAGRAGRGSLPGRVVIQSYNIDDFSILAACKQDYQSFYDQEIIIRKEMGYPPFTNIALVVMSGANDKTVQQSSKVVKDMIYKYFRKNNIDKVQYEVLGPLKPPISKIKNKYRWRLVIKSNDMDVLIKILRETADEFYREKSKSTVDLGIDIDPINML